MSIHCYIGGVLRHLKDLSGMQRHFFALVKECCGYKRSYTYWLISLHKLSEQYPLLKRPLSQFASCSRAGKI